MHSSSTYPWPPRETNISWKGNCRWRSRSITSSHFGSPGRTSSSWGGEGWGEQCPIPARCQPRSDTWGLQRAQGSWQSSHGAGAGSEPNRSPIRSWVSPCWWDASPLEPPAARTSLRDTPALEGAGAIPALPPSTSNPPPGKVPGCTHVKLADALLKLDLAPREVLPGSAPQRGWDPFLAPQPDLGGATWPSQGGMTECQGAKRPLGQDGSQAQHGSRRLVPCFLPVWGGRGETCPCAPGDRVPSRVS